jgi:predicted kinase
LLIGTVECVRRLTSVHLDAISSFVTTNDERVGALRATAETGEGDVPRMFVMVGLPSAGKTSRARELAATWDALRLTPDEWMIPLFGQEQPEGKRNVLEGRLIWLALSALRIGVNVVLDFGVWAKVERSALRALAASVGATSELVYLQVDEEEQWRRVQARALTDAATTFEMTKPDLERWRPIFQAPDATELGTTNIDPSPAGFESWEAWVAQWWPTSFPDYGSARHVLD